MPESLLVSYLNLVELMIRFLTRDKPGFREFLANHGQGGRRHGRGLVEIIVVTGIIAFAMMIVLVALPKGRETARMAGCQKNLMQIGIGLQMYHQAQGHYPTVPRLNGTSGDSPIRALFDAFVIPDLLELQDPAKPPRPTVEPARGTRVPGLTCPSDTNAYGTATTPFLSYRANTGDTPGGMGGPFEPGRTSSSSQIEKADGLSFTAAYAERLVGNGRDGSLDPVNYARAAGSITSNSCPDCGVDSWRGDAGKDWAEASWRSSIYNHALRPNAARSCISEDGRSALMGPASVHPNRINVLMMDGSLKGVTPTITPQVWQGMGTVGPIEEKKQ